MVERNPRANPEKLSGVQNGARQTAVSPPPPAGSTLTLGEYIKWHRVRRGMTQEVLAGLVGGRTADWLGKVERGSIVIDRLSVLEQLADALRIPLARLIDRARTWSPTAPAHGLDIDPLRHVLADYTYLTSDQDSDHIDLDVLAAEIGETWSAYQDSRYARANRLLPAAIVRARAASQAIEGHARLRAQRRLAMAYQGAAMLLTKIGETDLAWLAADRGLGKAFEADDKIVLGSLYRSVAHCLLANKNLDAATATVDNAAALLATDAHRGPDHLSIHGSLFLVGAMAAARVGDRREASRYLAHAQRAADRLGHDGNNMWTAFGPTTVRMHHVSAALELGDIETALAQGERIDTSALPVERRVRHKLDLARAHNARGHRDTAEALLLDANELAPEQVTSHYITAALLTTWARAPRETPNPHIVQLADKARIV
ncbi:MAG TPA: helix-turn-helix domain-containing protein [Actinospica sp.]|nr:helix-turn-helix domain-containing protein [Actinospica sp.]